MLELTTTSASRKRAKHRTVEQWQALITQQAQSKLSIKQFCLQQGITLSAFYNWRSKLNKPGQAQDSEVGTGFVEFAPPLPCTSSLAWTVELELGNGVILRLRQPSSEQPLC